MSVHGIEGSSADSGVKFDHAINLIDSSKVRDEADDDESVSTDTAAPSRRRHLRKEIAQRKYRKYQKDPDPSDLQALAGTSDAEDPAAGPKQSKQSTQGRLRDKIPFRSKKQRHKGDEKETTFIDVLYENQRGMFLCGIPLYSSNSLLNFDPSAWQTSTFQDSAVNITNAQLPDPSWIWAWKTWYVDMSHDVDEEGWEYSFSFTNNFVWHGNHPWFHSFCRRRRWVRKRVKIHANPDHKGGDKTLNEAHKLNADYFTIHAASRESRDSSADRSDTRRSDTMRNRLDGDGANDDYPVEIESVTALMLAMKNARIDREKIGAVAQFLASGGDELFYLADKMPFIMDEFIHQTSRRQLQHLLLRRLDDAITARTASHGNDADSQGTSREDVDDAEKAQDRYIENLQKAINASGVHVNDQDYWTDLRARATGSEHGPTGETHALDAGEAVSVDAAGDKIAEHVEEQASVTDEIKGISQEAELAVEPGIRRHGTQPRAGPAESKDAVKQDKGKSKV